MLQKQQARNLQLLAIGSRLCFRVVLLFSSQPYMHMMISG